MKYEAATFSVVWDDYIDWWSWFGNNRQNLLVWAHNYNQVTLLPCYNNLLDYWDTNWNTLYGNIVNPDKNKPRCPCMVADY